MKYCFLILLTFPLLFAGCSQNMESVSSGERLEDSPKPSADANAAYDRVITVDLGALEPLIAEPGSPDAVVSVREVAGTAVDQVAVGSCAEADEVGHGTASRSGIARCDGPTI